jgi:hypothetical protein
MGSFMVVSDFMKNIQNPEVSFLKMLPMKELLQMK